MKFRYLFVLAGFAGAAGAQSPSPAVIVRNLVFAPVGVATTETIQVNVANTATGSSSTAAACSGTISFTVAGAKTQPAAAKFTVAAGEIYSTDLAWANLGASGRAEVLVALQVSQTAGVPCAAISSVETYDTSSGVTHSYQTNPAANGPVAVSGGGFTLH